MNKFNKIFFGLVCLVLFFSAVTKEATAKSTPAKDCECYSDLDKLEATQVYKNKKDILQAICVTTPTTGCKDQVKKVGKKGKGTYLEPYCIHIKPGDGGVTAEARCQDFVVTWNVQLDSMLAEGKKKSGGSSQPTSAGESQIGNLIQKCGQGGMYESWPEDCKDITVFVSLLLQLANYLFGIIGALALGAFVYGGFLLILSQGNPEKVKQGTGAMINAVIGLLIAFGGYVLVSFLGEVLKLNGAFKLLK